MQSLKRLWPDKDNFILDFLNWGKKVEERLNKLETKTNEPQPEEEDLTQTETQRKLNR